MGRENHDSTSTMVHSSIALLQERFRQLQRVKEMREERELKKLFTHEVPKHFNSNSNINNTIPSTYESTRLFSHPELINISSSSKSSSLSPPHISLSLWPTSQDYTSFKKPCTTNYAQSLQTSWKSSYDCDSSSDSGVDTSLHL